MLVKDYNIEEHGPYININGYYAKVLRYGQNLINCNNYITSGRGQFIFELETGIERYFFRTHETYQLEVVPKSTYIFYLTNNFGFTKLSNIESNIVESLPPVNVLNKLISIMHYSGEYEDRIIDAGGFTTPDFNARCDYVGVACTAEQARNLGYSSLYEGKTVIDINLCPIRT